MKPIATMLLFVLFCSGMWGCRPRPNPNYLDISPTGEDMPKDEPKMEQPETVPEPEPEPEPTIVEQPEPLATTVQSWRPAPTVEDRLREVIAL